MRHWNAACVYRGSVSLSVQSALARRLCTSRWLPEPTLCNPHTLANISAELWVAAGVSVSKGRCWVCLWAIKCFYVGIGWLNGIGGAVECSRTTACGICLLLQSCTDQVWYDNTMVELQVTSGARLIRALGRNRALQLVVGGGNTQKFWELWCCCNVQIFHWFCALFCHWFQLLPPAFTGTTTSSDGAARALLSCPAGFGLA